MPRLRLFCCLLFAPLALGAAAAAHDDSKPMDMTPSMPMDMHGDAHEHMPMTMGGDGSFGGPGEAAAVTRTIAIVMGDFSFTPDKVSVKPGQVIRFVVKNPSADDHEFVLGDAALQAAHREEMAKAMESGEAMHHHGGGNAISVAAGATKELIWKFTSAGLIEYACNIPGHYEAGMKGEIAVAP